MANSVKVYWEKDTHTGPLQGKAIGILGYGNQGRVQALNLRDNGFPPIIGSRPGPAADQAGTDGFEVVPIREAAEKADFLFLLIPDEVQPQVFQEEILSGLREGDLLNFASGYNITYERIVPPDTVDVVMVAPRMIGEKFRERFQRGQGTPSFVAVAQDASGEAMARALAIGKGIGSASGGLFEVTFQDETFIDLYMEQVVWAGIMQWLSDSFEYNNTPRIIPAPLSKRAAKLVHDCAIETWRALGCRDYARLDFRMDDAERPFVLEVNPNPDISPDAGFAAALAAAGLTYDSFVNTLLENAHDRHPKTTRLDLNK